MVCYETEVHDEAVNFIEDNWDGVMSAIVDGERWIFDCRDLDDIFFESVTDRSYTLTDAAFVIENSNNVENDWGLWEGKDPSDALECQAAFTYSNDVRSKIEDIYEDLKDHYDTAYEEAYDSFEESNISKDGNDDYDPTEDAECMVKHSLNEYFATEYKDEPDVVIEPRYQIGLIEKYLAMGNESCRSGYPCGQSYIDARCGVGFGSPHEYDYVSFDHRISKMIPEIRGMGKHDVRKYLEDLKSKVDACN